MTFGQLVEYDMRNMKFVKNHTQDMMEKLFQVVFLKNQNWAYLWINSVKFYTDCFSYCMLSWRISKYIETKLQITCFYFIKSFYKK